MKKAWILLCLALYFANFEAFGSPPDVNQDPAFRVALESALLSNRTFFNYTREGVSRLYRIRGNTNLSQVEFAKERLAESQYQTSNEKLNEIRGVSYKLFNLWTPGESWLTFFLETVRVRKSRQTSDTSVQSAPDAAMANRPEKRSGRRVETEAPPSKKGRAESLSSENKDGPSLVDRIFDTKVEFNQDGTMTLVLCYLKSSGEEYVIRHNQAVPANVKVALQNCETPSNWGHLPADLLMMCVGYLDSHKDVARVQRVCKRWKVLSRERVHSIPTIKLDDEEDPNVTLAAYQNSEHNGKCTMEEGRQFEAKYLKDTFPALRKIHIEIDELYSSSDCCNFFSLFDLLGELDDLPLQSISLSFNRLDDGLNLGDLEHKIKKLRELSFYSQHELVDIHLKDIRETFPNLEVLDLNRSGKRKARNLTAGLLDYIPKFSHLRKLSFSCVDGPGPERPLGSVDPALLDLFAALAESGPLEELELSNCVPLTAQELEFIQGIKVVYKAVRTR